MARTFRGSGRGRLGLRRKTSWDLGPGQVGAQTRLSSTTSIIASSAITPTVDGLTVVRMRGELLLQLFEASATAAGFSGAFGIGLGSAAAVGVGVSAVEVPINNEDWDGWLYHRYFSVFASDAIVLATAASESGQNHSVAAALRIEVDSKAMRKISVGDAIYAAIQVTEAGVAQMDWYFNSRMLFMLP